MNAMSRKILEKKLAREAEGGNDPTDDTKSAVTSVAAGGQLTSSQRIKNAAMNRIKNQSQQPAKKIPTGTLSLNASKRSGSENQTSFAPKINKKSIQIAAQKREGKVEDHLIKQGELAKKKKADIEIRKAKDQHALLTKVSDKYILGKFTKEFEKVLIFVNTPPSEQQEN